MKKQLFSTFPGLEILSSEDVAAGDLVVVERMSLVQKCHLVMVIISQHVDKWTEMDILAGYADPLEHRGKGIIPLLHGQLPPPSHLPLSLQTLLHSHTYL